MTTQHNTHNLSPILIKYIDLEDSLDYESTEGEANSGTIEVSALVQQEKGNPVYKVDPRSHFQITTQTMSGRLTK